MFIAFLITLLPTLLLYRLLPKIGITIKSNYFLLTFAWFTGMYLFTFGTFFLALLFGMFTSAVLLKATYTMLLLVIFLLFYRANGNHWLYHLKQNKLSFLKKQLGAIFVIAACFFFSFVFFIPHLTQHNGVIYTSPVYWDFHWHAALIQNFVYGDNFPPQNITFAGIPETYHFFWGVLAGIYEVGGLTLAGAINTISIIGFALFLIALVGLSEEFFQTKHIGLIAILLTVTSSSLYGLYYFLSYASQPFVTTITNIFTNTAHPFYAAVIPGTVFNYYGSLFNLFYFLEERQLIFGAVFLLLCAWVLYKRDQFSKPTLLILGYGMGAFFLWHVYIAIMIGCALFFMLLFGAHRKQTAILLFGFATLFVAHVIYFKEILQSPWFQQSTENFPKFNDTFISNSMEPFSFTNLLTFYFFVYGLKPFVLLGSFLYLWRKQKKVLVVLLAFIIPTFLLVNMVQLYPASISENHKWLRPLDVFIDITSAVILYKAFFAKNNSFLFALGMLILFCLTISGVIELMPFLNSKSTAYYAAFPSAMTKAIWANAPPHATFVGDDTKELLLAGRKVFVADTLGCDTCLKSDKRKAILTSLYQTASLNNFCRLTRFNDIDFVEITRQTNSPLLTQLKTYPHFTSLNAKNEKVVFVDTKKFCKE